MRLDSFHVGADDSLIRSLLDVSRVETHTGVVGDIWSWSKFLLHYCRSLWLVLGLVSVAYSLQFTVSYSSRTCLDFPLSVSSPYLLSHSLHLSPLLAYLHLVP